MNYGPIKELDAYIMHKKSNVVFPRQQTQVENVNDQWQADLVDTKNKLHAKYVLTIVDVFSRYAFVRVMGNKSSSKTVEALRSILKDNSPPKAFYTDSGNEFLGDCNKMYEEFNIVHQQSRSVNKAAIVERFNRTLRQKIERYLTYKKTASYINVLQDLVYSHYHTIHPIHGYTPAHVYGLSKNAQIPIRYHMYPDTKPVEDQTEKEFNSQIVKFKFKINDYVRIATQWKLFEKHTGNKKWQDDVVKIRQLLPSIPPTYKLQPIKSWPTTKTELKELDAKFNRRYYSEELQLVPKPPDKKVYEKTVNNTVYTPVTTRSKSRNLKNESLCRVIYDR
jgi:hypothetical protein